MYFNIYIYSYLYDDYDYNTDFHVTVMLRSTMGLYGRSVIEVAYGEMILSLHRGCMGADSSRKVVGGVGMMHHLCLTYPSQHQCGHRVLFSSFQYI